MRDGMAAGQQGALRWSCRVSLRVRTPLMHPQRGVRRDLPVGLPRSKWGIGLTIGQSRYCQWSVMRAPSGGARPRTGRRMKRTRRTPRLGTPRPWTPRAGQPFGAGRAPPRLPHAITVCAGYRAAWDTAPLGIPSCAGYQAAWDSACMGARTGGDTCLKCGWNVKCHVVPRCMVYGTFQHRAGYLSERTHGQRVRHNQ